MTVVLNSPITPMLNTALCQVTVLLSNFSSLAHPLRRAIKAIGMSEGGLAETTIGIDPGRHQHGRILR